MARPWQFIVSTIASFWSYFNCVKISHIYKTELFLGGIQRFHALFSCFSLMFPNESTSSSWSPLSSAFWHEPQLTCARAPGPSRPHTAPTPLISAHIWLSPHISLSLMCSVLCSPQFSVSFFPSTWVLWTSYSVVFLIKIALVANFLHAQSQLFGSYFLISFLNFLHWIMWNALWIF